ncbi:MAG: protease complex subunit PrcB family protein [Acidobacteria bacterium]|nr:protease complex subunit PrcB family protein [Acidobacteriota bacterium]
MSGAYQKKRLIPLLLIGIVAAGACAVHPRAVAPGGRAAEVLLETVYQSSHSGLREEVTRVIHDEAEAAPFFRQLMAHRPEATDFPAVDFDRWMLLAVGLGSRRNGGYTVEITRVVQEGDGLVAYYVEKEPGPNCIVAQVISHPVHVVKIPVRTGTVHFHGEKVVDDCR